ncbi:hypothetical protein Tco_1174123 [Tanacetum coccineum]
MTPPPSPSPPHHRHLHNTKKGACGLWKKRDVCLLQLGQGEGVFVWGRAAAREEGGGGDSHHARKSLGRLWFILVLPRNLAVERAWSENSHLVLGPAGKFSKQGTQKQSGEHEAKQDNISGLSKRDVSEKSVPVVLVSII